jgi:hypothetical protein
MFSIGTMSMMVPAGRSLAMTPIGVALKGAGATPNEQVIMAPDTTTIPMICSFPRHQHITRLPAQVL